MIARVAWPSTAASSTSIVPVRSMTAWRYTFIMSSTTIWPSIAARRPESTQEEGEGRNARLLCERFGPLNFAMALVVEGERMQLVMRRCSLFGVPLPLALAPRIDAYEYVEAGRFRFHVGISHPLTGLIVRYRGWLVPAA